MHDFDTAKIPHAANWHYANNSLEGAMYARNWWINQLVAFFKNRIYIYTRFAITVPTRRSLEKSIVARSLNFNSPAESLNFARRLINRATELTVHRCDYTATSELKTD